MKGERVRIAPNEAHHQSALTAGVVFVYGLKETGLFHRRTGARLRLLLVCSRPLRFANDTDRMKQHIESCCVIL